MYRIRLIACLAIIASAGLLSRSPGAVGDEPANKANEGEDQSNADRAGESAQWGSSPARNNARKGQHLPITWDVGEFDNQGLLVPGTGRNIRWVAGLGSVSYGTPVVAAGKVFIGTNNGRGRLKRFPSGVDLGCLVCFRYAGFDQNGDRRISFEESMHRTISTVVVQDGLLVVPDFSGLVHCLDAKTGQIHWTHDLMVAVWGSPLVADGVVYIGDEEGKVTMFELSKELKIAGVMEMGQAVYSTAVAAGGVLYIASKDHLFAIAAEQRD